MATAVSVIKSGEQILSDESRLAQHLCNAFADKGIEPAVLRWWEGRQQPAHSLEQLVGHFLMRLPYDATSRVVRQSLAASLTREPELTYVGTPKENEVIDRSVADSRDVSGYRDRIGRGVARHFSLEGYRLPKFSRRLSHTPILIVGAGAAGVLVARTLINAGYARVRVIADQQVYGGLWNQKNVREGSKNNPFPFTYEQFRVEAAPGAGAHITRFLSDLANPARDYGMRPLPEIQRAKILSIVPGDLSHLVSYRDAGGEHMVQAPIVVNCLGIGKPLHPSREGVMTTDATAAEAGIRWQQIITPGQAERLQGKTLVFVGLGNSTAEMLVQIQRYRSGGLDIRYKVLTHYPQEALENPEYREYHREKLYELYRDINRPNLTRLAGDLDHISSAFYEARESEDRDQQEIISQVTHWTIASDPSAKDRKTMTVTRDDGSTRSFDFDQLYTLIGYGHSPDELNALGMRVTDEYSGTIAADYDGEIQRVPGAQGRGRLNPGYFAFGSLLKSPSNPNAQVIPGMLYRVSDLFCSITLRAAEYAVSGR